MPKAKSRLPQSSRIPWLTAAERTALEDYLQKVEGRYASRIQRIVLFGSRVRGEGNEDSDIDLAIILKKEDRHLFRELIDMATEIRLATEIRVSPLVFSEEEFQKLLGMERGIAVTIQREGVVL